MMDVYRRVRFGNEADAGLHGGTWLNIKRVSEKLTGLDALAIFGEYGPCGKSIRGFSRQGA